MYLRPNEYWRGLGLLLLCALSPVAKNVSAQQPNRISTFEVMFSLPAGNDEKWKISGLAADQDENLYVTGNIATGSIHRPARDLFVSKFDSRGRLIYSFEVHGEGNETGSDLAIGPAGEVYVVGTTRSPDFPFTRLYGEEPSEENRAAFILKLSDDGSSLDFAVGFGKSGAAAVTVDKTGCVFVTGSTSSLDFPVTESAFQTEFGGQVGSFGDSLNAFVVKLDPVTLELLYATYLGGSRPNCFGGSSCIGVRNSDSGNAIAVNSEGNAFVAGKTNARDFPTTAMAFQEQCGGCSRSVGDAFVAKLTPDGSDLVYSTYLGGRTEGIGDVQLGFENAFDLSISSDGSAYVTGFTASTSFPTTPGVVQPEFGDMPALFQTEPDAFVAKLSPDGSELVFSTYLGGESSDEGRAIALAPNGEIVITGTTFSADFPPTDLASSRGSGFLLHLNHDASAILSSTRLPNGVAGQYLVPLGGGAFYTASDSGAVSRIAPTDRAGPRILGVSNAAGGPVEGLIAPGEIVSIFGVGIGSQEPAPFSLGPERRLPDQIEKTRVFIEGKSIPLLYVQHDQINAIVPFGLAVGKMVRVQLVQDGVASQNHVVKTVHSDPGLFPLVPGTGHVAAIHEDGTINTRDNPAPIGSVVSLLATGTGVLDPLVEDGTIAGEPPSVLTAPIEALVGGVDAEVLYAGTAPGLVQGITQIDVRVPRGFRFGGLQSVVIRVGSAMNYVGFMAVARETSSNGE